MLNAGANWKELQERMGHRSISTTMDIYAKLDPNRKNEAVDILIERLAQIKKTNERLLYLAIINHFTINVNFIMLL